MKTGSFCTSTGSRGHDLISRHFRYPLANVHNTLGDHCTSQRSLLGLRTIVWPLLTSVWPILIYGVADIVNCVADLVCG